MWVIFENVLPIFMLLGFGVILKRVALISDAGWAGLEQLGFYVLYPTLLFTAIIKADFSAISLDRLMIALILAVMILNIGLYASWPLLKRTGLVARSEFSSVFQASVRWNGFMAFAIAENLFPPEGVAVVALTMAVIIIPINMASVFVVTVFAEAEAKVNWPRVMTRIATNPLIVGCLLAILVRVSGLYPTGPIETFLDMIGRSALGLGLMAIGAGLMLDQLLKPNAAALLGIGLKLFFFPALLVTIAYLLGAEKEALLYLALCGAVPTAMNGYLLAKQMGGDAPLYAVITTWQIIICFFSIPALLWLVPHIFGTAS